MTVRRSSPSGRRRAPGHRARYRAPGHGRPTTRRQPGTVTLLTAAGVAFVAGIATGAGLFPPSDRLEPVTAAAQVGEVADVGEPPAPLADVARGPSAASSSRNRERTPAPFDIIEEWGLPSPPASKAADDGVPTADRADGLLGTDVPERGDGELVVVPGSRAATGSAPVRTVRVEVEGGLPVDHVAFAEMVIDTLTDRRGWEASGEVAFAWTDGPADISVVLASPALTDELCAPLDTNGKYSCGRDGRAVLNFRRWVEPPPDFDTPTHYRQYLINHEVGHLLGKGHRSCPGAGAVAPVMQQQSASSKPCVANGWPFPDAGS